MVNQGITHVFKNKGRFVRRPPKPSAGDEQVFLSTLSHVKGVEARSLAGTLGYNATRAANVLNRLVKKGYAKRTGSIGHRNIRYWLTPKGLRATGRVNLRG